MASWPIHDTTEEFQRLILLANAAHHAYNINGPQRAGYELARLIEMAMGMKAVMDKAAGDAE